MYIFIRKKKRAVMFFELRVEREREINTNGNDSLTTNNYTDIFYTLLILHH